MTRLAQTKLRILPIWFFLQIKLNRPSPNVIQILVKMLERVARTGLGTTVFVPLDLKDHTVNVSEHAHFNAAKYFSFLGSYESGFDLN